MANWNPWHGCRKYSAGCLNCYVYRIDERHERDGSLVHKTGEFDLPIRRARGGAYKIPPGDRVWTCFTSDFLLEDADPWRPEAWRMMRERNDCSFFFITKRILRFMECVPPDWGAGYENVHICCTMENQSAADERLPVLREIPAKGKSIACEPLLCGIDFRGQLGPWVKQIIAGGESGATARPCRYEWMLDIRRQCMEAGVGFHFKQTGYRFVKDGACYLVPRPQQHRQAKKANIDYRPR